MKKIAVIGLGYVGLPLALLIAKRGYPVVGYDIDQRKLEAISNKTFQVEDCCVKEFAHQVDLPVTSLLPSSDIYILCVPTPVDEKNQPDLRPLLGAVETVAQVLEDGQLVIIESTVYPGMCEDSIKPLLDRTHKRYYLAHCPERINPGDKVWNVENIPRVIGGLDQESTARSAEFYSSVVKATVKPLSSLRNAEATKILENIFRDVNTALVNEMAQSFFRMGIDVKEVIDAASTKPFAYMPHFPGVGVGGHCIAVDPYYMIEKGREAGFDHELLRTARRINTYMPIYTVNLLQNTFNSLGEAIKGKKVGVYGLAYKPDVSDTRESPSWSVIKRLKELKEADVSIYDPHVAEKSTARSLDEFLSVLDALIICTAHKQIREFDYEKLRATTIRIIIDGRNCLPREKVLSLGIVYRGIGRR